MLTFQEIILRLQEFWCAKGCLLQQSYDTETGAGTFNPDSFLRSVGPEPYNVCNVEISRRPTDGRYGENPNRLQQFHQFQVIMKPSPSDIQALYLESLEVIGLKLKNHDIRFVHDDWESPTQGAWGLGWEVWCDGMEITQFTYFQSIGGIELQPVAVELAYGIERIAMFLQGVDNIYQIDYNKMLKYGDVFLQREKEYSAYNFESANVEMWRNFFVACEQESKSLLEKNLPIPAYDFAIKASHAFNMMEARGAISQSARVDLMHRVKSLCCRAAKSYLEGREKLGFPLLDKYPLYAKQKGRLKHISPPKYSSAKEDLLLEIGSEELPATFVAPAMKQLESNLSELLKKFEIDHGAIKIYGTPRRLSVFIEGLSTKTNGGEIEKRGPKVEVAFDADGSLSKQGLGFVSSLGLRETTLSSIESGKTPSLSIKKGYLLARFQKHPEDSAKILMEHLPQLILHLPFKKRMHWGNETVLYARPLRWIVAMLGKQVLPFQIAGIETGNTSYGHAQIAPKAISISHPKKYLSKLRKAYVIACPLERAAFIEKQLVAISNKARVTALQEEKVTAEVLYLSEYPTLALHHFNDRFLTLPDELLISEMIDHQRYYPLRNQDGAMASSFVVAVDKKPSSVILRNNQAVLEARLSDGLFLYQQDMRITLDGFNEKLSEVTVHEKLGSLRDKVNRIEILAKEVARAVNKPCPEKTARYCKADITSSVVYEFPDLQGTMGKYYALKQGESDETAEGIQQHWWPLNDSSPTANIDSGAIVAIADKCDTLMSYMGIGITASSSKDPYGLRRAARGILRTLIDKKWPLNLNVIVNNPEVIDFILQRLPGILGDRGFSKEEIALCLDMTRPDPYDIFCRVYALHAFRKSSKDFDHFHEIYKRARGQVADEKPEVITPDIFEEDAEKHLYVKLEEIAPTLTQHIHKQDYLAALKALSELSSPLASFFDHVRVQADDPNLRRNRIALLQRVFELSKSLIDFSRSAKNSN